MPSSVAATGIDAAGGPAGGAPKASPTRAPLAWAKAFLAHWSDDGCGSKAAALSFYTAFSLAPILVLVLIIASFVLDAATVQRALLQEATGLIGPQGADLLAGMLDRTHRPGQGPSAIVAAVLLLVGATTAFAELKDSLDVIFDAPKAAAQGLWTLIRTRLLSFGLILTLAFLLLVSLAANAAFAGLSGVISARFGVEGMWIGRLTALAVSLVGSFLLFFVVYWLLPARRLPLKPLLLGAVITTALFAVGRALIGLYLGHGQAVASFGTAGSLALLLLWVDYSALVFFAGAEFSNLLADHLAQRGEVRAEAGADSTATALAGAAARAQQIDVLEDRVRRARARLALQGAAVLTALKPDPTSPRTLLAAGAALAGFLLGRRVPSRSRR